MLDRRIKYLTFNEAAQYLLDAGTVTHRMGVGANLAMTTLSVPAGTIDAQSNGRFKRDDLNKLVSWTREMRRNGEL